MAENITIARPYAEAVFELARGSDALGSWLEALETLSVIVSDQKIQDCIMDPNLNQDQLYGLITSIAGDRLSPDQKNFVRVLVTNERLTVLPEIRDLFVARKNEHEGIKEADIASAFPLNDAAVATMKKDLEARFKCRLDVKVRVVPDLIGGVCITVGDEVIDASVRGKLANMAAALKN